MKQMRNVRFQRVISTITAMALLAGGIPGAAAEEAAASPVYLCGLEEHVHGPECYEKTLVCELEETEPVTEKRKVFVSSFHTHRHSDSCYRGDKLICGLEEGVYYHTHNEFCRDEEGKLVCGLETSKPHVHTDECYETAGTQNTEETGHIHGPECYTRETKLICGKAEEEGHTHTDACYTERKDLTCGLQEEEPHRHGDACYETVNTLSCGLEESEGHRHTEACHTITKKLACGQEEKEAHHHGEECRKVTDTLICGMEESEEHRHTEACHRIEMELVCGLEETDGHKHTDACYETTDALTCGLEEKEGHRHTEACYTPEKKLTCTRAETDGHRHTDECYTTTRELTCGREEKEGHTHSETCRETTDVLTCTLPEKKGTAGGESAGETKKLICDKPTNTHRHTDACYRVQGDGTKELICGKLEVPVFTSGEDNWTETEIVTVPGHRHTDECWLLSEEPACGKTEHIHTEACLTAKAAAPAGEAQAKDAEEPAGSAPAASGKAAEGDAETAEGTAAGGRETAKETAEGTAAGDAGTADQTTAETTEGTTEGTTEETTEQTTEETADGETEDAEADRDNEPHVFETEAAGGDGQVYRITVKTGANSGIPAKAALSVRVIREGSAEYESILGKAGETLRDDRKVEELYAFDISLVNPDNPEEHYQPADEASVSVSISVPDMKPAEKEAEVQVLHFAEEHPGEPEVLHTETVAEGNRQEEVSFDTDSFSTFVVMKTTAAGGTVTVACAGVSGEKECTALTPDMDKIGQAGQETWYAAEDNLTFTKRPEILGTVNLVLRKGKTLTAPLGINLVDGNKLAIRREDGADDGSATLNAEVTDRSVIDSAGIGADGSHQKAGVLEIHGGTVKARGADFAAGIGGGNGGYSGDITILGGIVTATGGHSAAGIGGGEAGSMAGTLSIRGGTVNATGGDNGAGIGGGQYFSDNIQYEKMVGGNGGNVVISAGKVTAKGGQGASGIGGGEAGSGGTLSINGPATVIAESGKGEGKDEDKPEAIGRGDKTYRTSGSEASSGNIAFSSGTRVYETEGGEPVAQDQRVPVCRKGWVKIESTAAAEEYAISTKLNPSSPEAGETVTVTDDKGSPIATAAAGSAIRIVVTCRVQVPKISCRMEAVYLEKDGENELALTGPAETEAGGVRTLTYTGTMPKADLAVTATLTGTQRTITIDAYDPTYGTVTVSPEKASQDERPTVTFTCAKGYEDYWLKTLKVTGKTSGTVYAEIKETGMPENIVSVDDDGVSWQFSMPDEDLLLTGITFGRGTHYVALNGESLPRKKCIEVTPDLTKWEDSGAEDGWYVVRGDVTMNGTIKIRREVNLVLSDGAKLKAPKGILVDKGKGGRLYIWAQENGTGSLEAHGDDDAAGIGADDDTEGGGIYIYGGNISAWGDTDSAGIGGALRSYVKEGITISVPAGYPDSFTTVNAWGGENGSGIGEGNAHNGGGVTITGGTVNAWGGEDGAGIGAGQDNNLFRPIIISGGIVHAYGGKNGAGIGLGPRYADHGGNMRSTIEITGANTYVYAEGGSEDGAGIGTGEDGNMEDNIIIRDATVEVVAHDGAAGIGGGQDGDTDKGHITIENARLKVTVTEGEGAGIGSGEDAGCGEITINGGVIEIFTPGSGGSLGGSKGEKNGKLNLYTHALVSAGSAGNYVAAADRINTCWSGSVHYLKIEPCTHPGGSITPVDHTNHNITCQWCGFNDEPEAHIFGTDRTKEDFYKCSCGYSRRRLVTGKADREGVGVVLLGLSTDDMKHAQLEAVPGDTVYVHLETAGGAKITGFRGSYFAEGDQEARAFGEFTAFPADKGKNYQFVMPDPDDERPELSLVMETSGGGDKAPIPDLAAYGVTYLEIISSADEEYLIAATQEEAEQKGIDPANWKSADAGTLAFEGLEPGKYYLVYGRTKASGDVPAGIWSDPLRALTASKLRGFVMSPESDLSVGTVLTVLPVPLLSVGTKLQWYRDDRPISGETKLAYTLTEADINHTVKVTGIQVIDKKGTTATAEKGVNFSPTGSISLIFQAADGSWSESNRVRTNCTVQGMYSVDEAYLNDYVPGGSTGDGLKPVSYSFGYEQAEDKRTPIPKDRVIPITQDDAELCIYFERNLFTLRFYPDMDGKGTPETVRVPYGAALKSYSGKKASAAGYTFTGWSESKKPAGTEYGYVLEPSGGKEFPNFTLFALEREDMPAKDLNLYPVMVRPRVEVRLDPGAVDANANRYNMNGWRNPVTYTDDATKAYLDATQVRRFTTAGGSTLAEAIVKRMAGTTRDGYELDGWYSASGVRWDGSYRTTPLFCDSLLPEKREGTSYLYYTLTLKAGWNPRKATLHYDLGEGSWSGADQENIAAGSEVKVSEETVKPPEGKKFLCWKDKDGRCYAGGSTLVYDDLGLVTEIGKEAKPNVITLTAQYFEFPHIVAFDTQGGSPVDPILPDESTKIASLAGKKSARTGSEFIGWALSKDSQETVDEVSFAGGESVIWVYAVWEAKDYPVYFFGNGGTVDGKSIIRKDYPFGQAIKDRPTPAREHFEFAGWSPALPFLMPARLVVTGATWKPASHTWTFDAAGGSETAPITALYGAPVPAPEDPVREGYVFMGWMSEGAYAALPEHMDGDRTYTAGWKALRDAPEPPVITLVTTTMIEVEPREGEEYAIVYAEDGTQPGEEDWKRPDKDGNLVFYLRTPNTRYYIYARYIETEENLPSRSSEAAEVKTKRIYPDAPEVTAGFRAILAAEPDDAGEHTYQYSADKGKTWSDGPVIRGLQPDTAYRVGARWGEPRIFNLYPKSKETETTTDTEISGVSVSDGGTLRIGDVIEASYAPADAERVAWQWYREGNKTGEWTLIEGAEAASYTVTAADAGRKLRVVASQKSRLPAEIEGPVLREAETGRVKKPGKAESIVLAGTNVPDIELAGMTEKLILAIAGPAAETRRTRGENLLLAVRVNDISGTISAADKKLIDNALKAANSGAGALQYLDISVYLTIGNDEPVRLTDLGGNKIQMKLTVPKKYIVSGNITRTYYIARLHGGKAGILAKGTQTTIGFASALFSPYALGYSDQSRKSGGGGSGGGSGGGTAATTDTRRYFADFRFTLYPREYPEAEQERMKGYEELINGLELQADILRNPNTKALDISALLMPAGKPEVAVPIRVFGNQTDACVESRLLGPRPYYLGDTRKLTAYAARFTQLTGLPAATLGLLHPDTTKLAAGEVLKAWRKDVPQLAAGEIGTEQIGRIRDSLEQMTAQGTYFRNWLDGFTACLAPDERKAAEEILLRLPGALAEAAGGESLAVTETDGAFLCANAKGETVFRLRRDDAGTFFELFTANTAETGRPYLLYEKKNGSVRIAAEWIRDGETLLDLKLEISGIPAAFPGTTRMNVTLHSGGKALPAAEMTALLTMDAAGKTELTVSTPDGEGNVKPLFRAYGSVTPKDLAEGQGEMPVYDSPTLKQYPALLNEKSGTIGELLAFATPEWTTAVERLLKTLSEHGFTVLTDDLDKHGIP